MVALIQNENHAANEGETAGMYQFDTHPTIIGLRKNRQNLVSLVRTNKLTN